MCVWALAPPRSLSSRAENAQDTTAQAQAAQAAGTSVVTGDVVLVLTGFPCREAASPAPHALALALCV